MFSVDKVYNQLCRAKGYRSVIMVEIFSNTQHNLCADFCYNTTLAE